MSEDADAVVVIVRHNGRLRYFRSDSDLWVLDVEKWRQDLVRHGYNVPQFNDAYRFGMRLVNHDNADAFLDRMEKFEVPRDRLSHELAKRYITARSWSDVQDLFPIMFVDFDARKVAATYWRGPKMERYVPDGWTGEFVDFIIDYDERVFPEEEKFWIKGGCNLLTLLLERSSKS